jgi:hypothetical protein
VLRGDHWPTQASPGSPQTRSQCLNKAWGIVSEHIVINYAMAEHSKKINEFIAANRPHAGPGRRYIFHIYRPWLLRGYRWATQTAPERVQTRSERYKL